MHEDDAVRRVHVERLRLLLALGRALRGVAHVAEADVAEQRAHVARAERLAHLPARLRHVEHGAVGGRDAGRVLAAVLQEEQAVVDLLVDGLGGDDADDAAHASDGSSWGWGSVRAGRSIIPHPRV